MMYRCLLHDDVSGLTKERNENNKMKSQPRLRIGLTFYCEWNDNRKVFETEIYFSQERHKILYTQNNK